MSAVDCEGSSVTAPVVADTWLDENSPGSRKGSDSVLSVEGGSLNVDTGIASGRARALFRFAMPTAVPEGCVVESARLYVFSSEASAGERAEAVRLAGPWTESEADWSNQPGTVGDAVRIWSREGYMQWNVTAQVQAMLDGGVNHGFLIRDAFEAIETAGGHDFYSREKGDADTQPELVIRFASPASNEAPGPPVPPQPATVQCGQVLMQSTLVTNDLSGCLGHGLVIGAPRVIVDLGGHTIDGTGLGSGILNEGHTQVTVRNGTLQDFDYGVQLFPETTNNVVEDLTFRLNQVAAVELFDVSGTEVRGNALDGNAGGILFISGTRDSVAENNTITANGGAGLVLQDATGIRLENNSVTGGGDLGIGLERASRNSLIGNTSTNNSDGGIELHLGSHHNLVEGNTVLESGDHGILVMESDGNELTGNVVHFMSDSGITLNSANDGVVRGNDVRFNTGGLQMDGSSRNVIESNDASETSGIGIELGGGSLQNQVEGNTASANGAQGIYVADDAADLLGNPVPELGNRLVGNIAMANKSDGIVAAKGGHTIANNVTRNNLGWGILASLVGTIDGGGNVASGNGKPEQCQAVVCKAEWVPPDTDITDSPPASTRVISASFRFTGSDNATPAVALRFACSLDGGAFVACTSPRLLTGLADGPHAFAVRATDAAANTDPTPATFTWTIDSTPPETSLSQVPNELGGASATFGFGGADNATASDDLVFECALDGAAFATCGSPLTLGDMHEGVRTFAVRAIDMAGNVDLSPASHTWTVDTSPPETTIGAGPSDPTRSTDAGLAFGADEAASFACALDDGPFAPCSSPATYAGLSDGRHTFAVVATDAAGNADASPAGVAWTVDTTPPDVSIASAPSALTNQSSATFVLETDEAGATFACSLDGNAYAPCAASTTHAGLADGPHTFAAVATDAAGNTDPSPAGRAWTIDSVSPGTTLGSVPATPTNGTTASFTFSADEPASFECAFDEASFSPCVSPATHAGLTAGDHLFRVRAIDAAGNPDGSPAAHAWIIDLTPPDTIVGLGPSSITSSTSASFEFSASEPGVTFACALDDGPVAACVSPQEYTSLVDGAHVFSVRATDAAGNVDDSPASRTWTVDTIQPETTISSGPASITNLTAAIFTFTADESASFACALDDRSFVACAPETRFTALAEGAHSLSVRATDPAGNTDASAAVYGWTVDLTPPDTNLGDRPADLTNSADATFTFSGIDAASDAEALTFACALDDGAWAACSTPTTYGSLAEGRHSLAVAASDPAGNTDASPASHAWTIDLTAPETTINAGPAAITNQSTAAFELVADETGVAFACSLDDAIFVPCNASTTYVGLGDGVHTLLVRATDGAGNSDATPASRTWSIDTVPPQTTLGLRPSDPSNSSSASFTFTGDEPGAFECAVGTAEFEPCESPATLTDLADGAHTFAVRAIDAAGNTDDSPASHAWTIDTTAPQTTITAEPSDPTRSIDASLSFTSDESATFACSLDAAPFASCSSPATYAALSEGRHTFDVVATDAAGNADPSAAGVAWTVDTTPPQTIIAAAPPAMTSQSSAGFTLEADAAGATFACSIDSLAFIGCAGAVSYIGLADGPHTFAAVATDPAGNTDPSPATHEWTVDSVAPETNIGSRPDDPTNATGAAFTFSADESGSFACALDEASFAPCDSPLDHGGLSEGSHMFRVRAIDAAGNADASPATYAWTIDRTPPETTIDVGPAATTDSSDATFTFSAGEVVSFACALDGASFEPCTSPAEYAGLAEGTHQFEVRATDTAGNTDPTNASRTWTITGPADTTAPDTTIDTGPSGTTTAIDASFAFTSTEAGSTFACALDGGSVAACVSPQHYTGLADGTHTFNVSATDAAGNTDASAASRTWTIDTIPPETTISGGPTEGSTTASTSATFSFTSTEANSTFACSLDGGPFAECASPSEYTGLANGTHTFSVRATDAAGNTDASAAGRTWTVAPAADVTPPDTVIDGGPTGSTNATVASFVFSSTEPSSTFQCSLDSITAFSACISPRQYSGLSAGSHTFRVRAIDAAGNTDPSPASRTWTVDTAPPNTTISGGPAAGSTSTSTSASFTFTATEAGSTFQCSLDSTTAYAACSSPRAYSGLTVGTHTFRVRATDAAGNTDATPASRSWTVQGDTTPPNTTITGGPTAGSITTSTSASFTFSASETGSTFQCSLDSTIAYAACSSPWAYTGLTAGTHTFRVRAIDGSGNTDATPASRSWTVEVTSGCGAPLVIAAAADAWIEQNSPSSNRGSDSILKVKSQGTGDNFRALVQFMIPTVAPAGCRLDTATLRLYAASATTGRTLLAAPLAAPWTENGATWANQPSTTGSAAATSSGSGYREWNVTSEVAAGMNNGFLIRDSAEGASGMEQSFHAREKGESPPQLVLRYVPETSTGLRVSIGGSGAAGIL